MSIQTSAWSHRAGLPFVHGGGLTGTQPDSPRPAPNFVFREAEVEATGAVAVGAVDDEDEDDALTAAAVAIALVELVGAECSPTRW